jgi:hypothetical protein
MSECEWKLLGSKDFKCFPLWLTLKLKESGKLHDGNGQEKRHIKWRLWKMVGLWMNMDK